MGLFTMHHSCVSCLLDYLKLKLDSKSRLPCTEFAGYHCRREERLTEYIQKFRHRRERKQRGKASTDVRT